MPRLLFDFQSPVPRPRLANHSSALRLKSRHSATVTFGVARSCAVPCNSLPLYLIIVEIQNSLVHVFAVKCPKCSHYQDFSSLGACETCGRSDWVTARASVGTIVVCPYCERGHSEIPCEKCGAAILGSWLSLEPFTPRPVAPKAPEEPLAWWLIPGVVVAIVVIAAVAMAWLKFKGGS